MRPHSSLAPIVLAALSFAACAAPPAEETAATEEAIIPIISHLRPFVVIDSVAPSVLLPNQAITVDASVLLAGAPQRPLLVATLDGTVMRRTSSETAGELAGSVLGTHG